MFHRQFSHANTTPKAITDEIRQLCGRINPNCDPTYVPVSVEQQTEVDECFANVEAMVAAQGGRKQLGWIIWEWPQMWLEALFHCVWVRPDGALLDISPKPEGEASILFLADSSTAFDGRPVPSRRKALNADPLVRTYLREMDRMDHIARRTFSNGQATIPRDLLEAISTSSRLLMERHADKVPSSA